MTLNGLDVSGGELTVYEKNLTYGTDPDAPALTQTGTFTVTALGRSANPDRGRHRRGHRWRGRRLPAIDRDRHRRDS